MHHVEYYGFQRTLRTCATPPQVPTVIKFTLSETLISQWNYRVKGGLLAEVGHQRDCE